MNKKLLDYFKGDELSANVWKSKYAAEGEETPDDMHRRLAKEFARVDIDYQSKEKDNINLSEYGQTREKLTEERIYDLFKDFKYVVPQGSVMYGLGRKGVYVSLSNCFFVGSPPNDSYSSIMYKDEQIVQLMKRRAGVGIDISTLRPRGAKVSNSAGTSTGAASFMERYSNSTREVGQENRRGALLQSISVNHPDVLEFATIKSDNTKVTGANVSIKLNNEFMEAVNNDEDYFLRFPCDISYDEIDRLDKVGAYRELIDCGNGRYVKRIKAREYWDEFIEQARDNSEPGLLFWDNVVDNGPDGVYDEFRPSGTNPCFTGDTLIGVADGRPPVSIKELAEQGEDVPVYSIDPESGELSVKNGRNPRLTGKSKKILRVHLSNDSHIDVTPTHKFILKNGGKKEAKDLCKGDSIPSFRKAASKYSKPSNNEYYRIYSGIKEYSEHRMIAEYYQSDKFKKIYDEQKENGWVKGGLVVHHKDYNGLNNSPDNLEIMTFKDHQQFHADHDNYGENNGRWSGFSNEEIKDHAVKLCKKLNRRFSCREWMKYAEKTGLPKTICDYRSNNWFNTIKELSEWAGVECGFMYIDVDPRVVRTLMSMKEQGYESKIEDGKVMVKKICEYSGEGFWVQHTNRNISFSSIENALRHRNEDENFQRYRIEQSQKGHEKSAEKRREDQARIYSELEFNLGRSPLMKEWEKACKEEGVPHRVGKKLKFNYKNFKEVEEAGKNYNHKVVKTEMLEDTQDVYNITVDDNHTVAIATKIYRNKKGNNCYSGIYTMQCGEITLQPMDSCRLMLVNMFSYVEEPFKEDCKFDFNLFYKHCYEQQRLMDNLVDLEIEYVGSIINKIGSDPDEIHIKSRERSMWEHINTVAKRGRRTGAGITALGDTLAAMGYKYDSEEAIDFVGKVMRTKMEAELDATIDLAIIRGPFKGWDDNKEFPKSSVEGKFYGNNYFYRLEVGFPDQARRMKKFGRRNVSFSTIAPAGSVSILTQTTSGCEPLFQPYYIRRKKLNHSEIESEEVDFIDQNGDKWREYAVLHPKFKDWIAANYTDIVSGKPTNSADLLEETLKEMFEESPWYGSTANDIDWIKRVEMQATLQKYVSHSISSTLNLPEDVTYEEVSEIYMEGYKQNLKGITIYRDGSRSGVLVTNTDKYKRPVELPCQIFHNVSNGKKFTTLIGLKNNLPFEIFCVPLNMATKYDEGLLVKEGDGNYTLKCGEDDSFGVFKDVTASMTPEHQNLTRMWSLMLKHEVPVNKIIDQIKKVDEGITAFSRVVTRVLGNYVPDGVKSALTCLECGSNNVIFEEGCSVCKDCGNSACG